MPLLHPGPLSPYSGVRGQQMSPSPVLGNQQVPYWVPGSSPLCTETPELWGQPVGAELAMAAWWCGSPVAWGGPRQCSLSLQGMT